MLEVIIAIRTPTLAEIDPHAVVFFKGLAELVGAEIDPLAVEFFKGVAELVDAELGPLAVEFFNEVAALEDIRTCGSIAAWRFR